MVVQSISGHHQHVFFMLSCSFLLLITISLTLVNFILPLRRLVVAGRSVGLTAGYFFRAAL